MKSKYVSPEIEIVKFSINESLLNSSDPDEEIPKVDEDLDIG